jgi:ParB/RepB/Spo0J family partition protein
MSHAITAIELKDLAVSSSGPQVERRKHFNKAAIEELADSIATVGVLSPILVRPVNGHFELVFGERRYMAAKLAGLAQIPASVRELTDEQVLEVQLIENLQREGLHELAEAEGYEALLKLGHSAEEIAEKIGKSKAYIYARMKLLALCKDARKGFYEGKISASIALLLARIPVESLQKQAFKEITEPDYNDEVTYRQAAELIHQDYMTRLSEAGFPTQDATLVPAAGPCGSCPKRTGNQPELFGDVKGADVCTDPICFKAKRDAHAVRTIAEAKATGQKVISGKEAKQIAPNGADSSYLRGYDLLDAKPSEDPKHRTVRQLLGKDYQPTLLHDPETGKLVKVAPEADIKKALKDAGVKPTSSGNPEQTAREKKAKAERAFRQVLFAKVRESYPTSLARADWNDLVIAMVHEMQQETVKHLFSLWAWEPKKERYGNGNYRGAAAEIVPKLSGAEMSVLLFDCIFVSDLAVSTWSDAKPQKLFAAAKRFKINVEALRRAQNAAAIPKAKKKAKAKK